MDARFWARMGAGVATLMLLAALPSAAGAVVTKGDTTVDAANVYLHSQVGEPWGENGNDTAMNTVFGAANWDEELFETVGTGTSAGGLFSPDVKFIFLDGSDGGANELEAFIAANQPALKSFVERGGGLIVNSAPNEGNGLSYDGRAFVYTAFARQVVAADPGHSIFTGPSSPAGTAYSGNYFGHAVVTGPGLTPIILRRQGDVVGGAGDPAAVVLAEYYSGCGITLLGGMTMPAFHQPAANAANLRANIVAHAAQPSSCSAPSAETGGASDEGLTGANLNGTVDPGGLQTTYRFEYGTSTSYGSQTADESAGSGTSADPKSASISGLLPFTTYHYRLVATNSQGTSEGLDRTFTTGPGPEEPQPARPEPEPAPTTPAAEPAAREARVAISHRNVLVRRGKARIVIRCGSTGGRCKGSLAFEATALRSRLSTLAAARPQAEFDVAPGSSQVLRLAVPSGTISQLRASGKAIVQSSVQLGGTGADRMRLLTMIQK